MGLTAAMTALTVNTRFAAGRVTAETALRIAVCLFNPEVRCKINWRRRVVPWSQAKAISLRIPGKPKLNLFAAALEHRGYCLCPGSERPSDRRLQLFALASHAKSVRCEHELSSRTIGHFPSSEMHTRPRP